MACWLGLVIQVIIGLLTWALKWLSSHKPCSPGYAYLMNIQTKGDLKGCSRATKAHSYLQELSIKMRWSIKMLDCHEILHSTISICLFWSALAKQASLKRSPVKLSFYYERAVLQAMLLKLLFKTLLIISHGEVHTRRFKFENLRHFVVSDANDAFSDAFWRRPTPLPHRYVLDTTNQLAYCLKSNCKITS